MLCMGPNPLLSPQGTNTNSCYLISLRCWFPNLSGHQHPLGGLVKTQMAGRRARASDSVACSGAWVFEFLTHSQVMLLPLLPWGPHFENHCPKGHHPRASLLLSPGNAPSLLFVCVLGPLGQLVELAPFSSLVEQGPLWSPAPSPEAAIPTCVM